MTEFFLGVAVGVIPTYFVTRWYTELRVGLHEAKRVFGRRNSWRK